MDRRTALQALIAIIVGMITREVLAEGHTLEKETEIIDPPMIYLPEVIQLDLTGVKEIRIAYKDRTVVVQICEMMNALSGDQSGQLVYTPGQDLCK
jgi:hypothetical protein